MMSPLTLHEADGFPMFSGTALIVESPQSLNPKS
jgi:hypothetical protein